MKKLSIFALALVLALSMAACTSSDNTTDSADNDTQATAEATPSASPASTATPSPTTAPTATPTPAPTAGNAAENNPLAGTSWAFEAAYHDDGSEWTAEQLEILVSAEDVYVFAADTVEHYTLGFPVDGTYTFSSIDNTVKIDIYGSITTGKIDGNAMLVESVSGLKMLFRKQ